MNIVRISAGLGNQMFQYALYKALQAKNNEEVAIDTSEFEYRKHHQGYELEKIFPISPRIATKAEVKEMADTDKSLLSSIRRDFLKIKLNTTGNYFKESGFAYIPEVLDMTNTYFQGFWQSWKYFENVEAEVRKDFQFSTPLSPENEKCIKEIEACESVSIHIRRGDYVKSRRWEEIGSICNLDYFKWAIANIHQQLKGENVHFFIFSDDIEWAKTNLNEENATYISWNKGSESYNDMRLMSHCKHNIIANSSFSWWGAFLNPNPDKIVIAPNKWYRSTPTPDLIPQDWTQLPID